MELGSYSGGNETRQQQQGGNRETRSKDDIDESEVKDYKEMYYKLFQLRDFQVKRSGGAGGFGCPFCGGKDETGYDYTHLLQHAIRVAEGSISRKQRARHCAMARYLAIDLALAADDVEWSTNPPKRFRSASSGEIEDLDKVREMEIRVNEMTEEINALIIKERSSNDELVGVRRQLIVGMSDFQCNCSCVFGVKKIGELDPKIFTNKLHEILPEGEDIVMKGVELATEWQEKLADPHWYPFKIVDDENGKPQRLIKEDDITLQALKEELGEEIYDAVVQALIDIQEHNPSGCYIVRELWNFSMDRKASLVEVTSHLFQHVAGKAEPQKGCRSSMGKC